MKKESFCHLSCWLPLLSPSRFLGSSLKPIRYLFSWARRKARSTSRIRARPANRHRSHASRIELHEQYRLQRILKKRIHGSLHELAI